MIPYISLFQQESDDMRITLGQLRRIIREEVQKSQYEFIGDVDELDEEAQEHLTARLQELNVKPGKVKVKKGKNDELTFSTSDGREFNVKISRLDDPPAKNNGPLKDKNQEQSSGSEKNSVKK